MLLRQVSTDWSFLLFWPVITMINDYEAWFLLDSSFFALFLSNPKWSKWKLLNEYDLILLLVCLQNYQNYALFVQYGRAITKKNYIPTTLFPFELAHRHSQRYQVFFSPMVPKFKAKQNQIVVKNATIIRNGIHPFREKVENRVILSNEQQLNKNSSYISKLEPFSQKFQEILFYKWAKWI